MSLRRTLVMALAVGLLSLFVGGSVSAAVGDEVDEASQESGGAYDSDPSGDRSDEGYAESDAGYPEPDEGYAESDEEYPEMSDEWEYDTYYIFPLTRHMPDSELPMAGQIALYPLAFIIDLGQWPIGARDRKGY